MDKIFIGDIDTNYNKAVFSSSNYIDLYSVDYIAPNQSVTYYRLFFYGDSFYYSTNIRTAGYNGVNLNTTTVEVSQDVWARRDIDKILTCTLILCVLGFFLINLVTSIIRRGGVLGGLF